MKPNIDDYFESASLLKLMRDGHPYNFRELYTVLKEIYGYQLDYVNLGIWDKDRENEAGRKLVYYLGDKLGLKQGDTLLEVGSGLGQASIDLLQHYNLGQVYGININDRQLKYANDLVASAGLEEKIKHKKANASEDLGFDCFKHVMAVECINHFPDIPAFLRLCFNKLPSGGRLVFCLNMNESSITGWDKLLLKLGYGFIPRTREWWNHQLTSAGFANIGYEDLTDRVLGQGTRLCLDRLKDSRRVSGATKFFLKLQLQSVLSMVDQCRLGYGVFWMEKPGPDS